MDQNDTDPAPPRPLLDQIRSGNPLEQQAALGFVMGAWVEHVDGDYCPILGCPACADKAAGITPIKPSEFRMRVTGISEGKLTVERVPTSWKIPEVPATEWTLDVPGKIRQAFPSSWANASPQICGKPMEYDARSRCVLPKGHELDDFDVTTCPKEHEYQLDVERILRSDPSAELGATEREVKRLRAGLKALQASILDDRGLSPRDRASYAYRIEELLEET